MNLRPLGRNVVVEKIEVQDQTESGLYIPDVAKEKPQTGRVIAVGDGDYVDGIFVETSVYVGDTVLFNKYIGSEFKLEDKKVVIMSEKDILAVLEPEDDNV